MPKTAATENFLDSLSVTPAKQKPASKVSGDAPVTVDLLAHYTALYRTGKEIEAVLETHPLKKALMRLFVGSGRPRKECPASFKALDGDASASVQFRKKDNRTNLADPKNADKLALATDLAITVEHFVVIPATMRVKPQHFDNKEMLNKILGAVKAAGLEPAQIFDVQAEESREIVCDATVKDIFSLGENTSDERVAELLEMFGGVTVVPKWNGTLAAAFEVARVELSPTPAEMKAREQAAAQAGAGRTPTPTTGSTFGANLKASMAAEGGFPASDAVGAGEPRPSAAQRRARR